MRRVMIALVALLLFTAPAIGAGIGDVDTVVKITAVELKAKLDRGDNVLIIDVRSSGAYAASSVKLPGDVRMAPDEIIGRVGEIPMGAEIVTYCT